MDQQTCKLEVESCAYISRGCFFSALGCGTQETTNRVDSERDSLSLLLPLSPCSPSPKDIISDDQDIDIDKVIED